MSEGAPHPGPALGILEIGQVARGLVVADGMVKRAAATLVRAAAVTPGKFVVVVAGAEEEVRQAMEAGEALSAGTLVDRLHLPYAHEALAPALRGHIARPEVDALGVVETYALAAAVLAADAALKEAAVTLIQLRLARGLGGKGYFTLTGALDQVEAAVSAARAAIDGGMFLASEIIPRPHDDLIPSLFLPYPEG